MLIFDIAALIATTISLIFVLFGCKDKFASDVKVLLTGLFVLTFLYNLSMVLEWSGITKAAEPFEDVIGALIPMWWAFIFYSFLQNISQKDLQKSETKYRTLTENLNVGIYRTTVGPSGKFIECNSALVDMFGFSSKEELLGVNVSDLYQYPDQREAFTKKLSREGQTLSAELNLKKKDGSEFIGSLSSVAVADDMGAVKYFDGVIEDITQRKQFENILKASEQRYQQLFDDAPVGYHEIDSEGRIVKVNKTELNLLGYTVDEMIGKPIWKFLKNPEGYKKKVAAKISGNNQTDNISEYIFICKNKSEIEVNFEDRLIITDSGEVTGIRTTSQDITEKKQIEKQLRHAQKLESITKLTGGIAHDFNNILGAIFGSIDMIMMHIPEGHPGRRFVDIILDKGQKAADLVKQMLAYSRQQQLNKEPIIINTTINDLSLLLDRAIEERIKLILKLADDLQPINGDKTAVDQIIMNLCVNAIDAMPDGGTLTVMTKNLRIDGESVWNHPDMQHGKYVLLEVTDTGIGIKADQLDRIFEPFYTTKEIGEGTGLGLSMVFGLVKQHEGYIYCTSVPEKGTTFEVFFPVFTTESIKAEVKEIDQSIHHDGGTILIVEDEPDLVEILKDMLVSLGFEVLVASDGIMALDEYNKYHSQIDLVISDIIMPKMGGKELYKKLKEVNPQIKFLFTSGYASTGMYQKYTIDKGMKILNKPFRLREISEHVKEVLNSDQSND